MTRSPSAFTCTITPFDAEGQLDETVWAAHLDRLADAGMGVYVGSSSPGEGYSLELGEVERLYGIAAERVVGRAPARAMGVETHTAEEYLELVAIAGAVGLEAMQIYCVDCGHANKPTEDELEHYFRTVLDGSSIPCVLSSHIYNGYVLPLPMLDQLLGDYGDHIIGVNVTNTDIAYVTRLVDTVDGRCDVHVGGPMQALTVLALGGQGFLSTDGNIIPRTCVSVTASYADGDLQGSHDAYAQVMRFFSANVWPNGSMRFLKAAMEVLGMGGHHLRPPFRPLADDQRGWVRSQLEGLSIPELSELLSAADS